MTILGKLDIGIKDRLKEKLESYLDESGDKSCVDDNHIDELVESLLSGRNIDFSGVTAIRGFIYQYYVAAKYLVDMLFDKRAWWNKVVFELLDDIALCSDKKIRFVQVKTKRESNVNNPLILSELHERKKGKGSWLDKLFLLNTYILNDEGTKLIRGDQTGDKYELEFEIATNSSYNDAIAVYERDDNYYSEVEEKEYEKLIKKMKEPSLNWKAKYKDKEFVFNKDFYEDETKGIKWYLEKFRVKRHGDIIALENSIINTITSHTAGTKSDYHKYQSKLILNKILIKVIERTCQDNENVEQKSFIFEKEEFQEMFKGFLAIVDTEAVEEAHSNNLHKMFTGYFDSIYKGFEAGNWNVFLKQELLTTMVEVRDYFLNKVSDYSDPYIYHRFLNRLFNLKNLDYHIPIDQIDDPGRIRDALKVLIYCLVFYKQKQYTPKNAELLLIRGIEESGEFKVFSAYNHRKKGNSDLAVKFVRASAMQCSASGDLNHDYYCLIADYTTRAKRGRREIKKQDSVNISVIELPTDMEGSDMEKAVSGLEITEVIESIKFLPLQEVQSYFDSLEGVEDIETFRTEEELDLWGEELDKLVNGWK
ncbi:dsDNA nuclease domain-containing protein [Priestia megaterium]|uniref:dsDNA nuclease domain-containing protein n=1 Tax=Priestia megaterium TaxID=1404 RepID=UPI000BF90966|nr:dsDNA nuclease domain-containing protein [Priestia megaterium]PFW47269.1 hypothetical protein COL17_22100 [Priestia megaterium]